MISAEILAFLL